jgi:ribosome-associated protein
MDKSSEVKKLVNTIFEAIEQKQGNNTTIIEFTPEITTICDYFVITDAQSERQVKAISDFIQEFVKKNLNLKPVHIDGQLLSQWIVLDYVDVIVHIFLDQTREFYAIEKLWADATFYNKPLN